MMVKAMKRLKKTIIKHGKVARPTNEETIDAIRMIVEKASEDKAAQNSYAFYVVEDILEVLKHGE